MISINPLEMLSKNPPRVPFAIFLAGKTCTGNTGGRGFGETSGRIPCGIPRSNPD